MFRNYTIYTDVSLLLLVLVLTFNRTKCQQDTYLYLIESEINEEQTKESVLKTSKGVYVENV